MCKDCGCSTTSKNSKNIVIQNDKYIVIQNDKYIQNHDSKIIEKAIALSKSHHKRFEFQMLKGIRDEIKSDLVKRKVIVSDYIPYGTNWIPYSFRRILERKRNILLLGSSFFQSHRV